MRGGEGSGKRQMKIFAHRGRHGGGVAENTLRAFQGAVDAGADGIETDIRVDSNGVPVLFHDRTVGGIAVADLSRDEIAAAAGHPVATLDEALSQGWTIEWNFELKTQPALAAAAPVLLRHAGRARYFVSSFFHPLVRQAARDLGARGGLLIAHDPGEDHLPSDASEEVPYLVWDFETATPDALARARARGWKNIAYGPATPAEHDFAASLGLAALITDHLEMAGGG